MVWHDAIEYTGYFICTIINDSMKSGYFPDTWKTSVIRPIPKKNQHKKCNEFRPINGMPIDEKILECVVKIQLSEYLETNKLLSEHQSAYRPKHSCESALNLIVCM